MSHSTTSLDALTESGFYPDILASLNRYIEFMHTKKMCKLGREIVEEFALGYLHARTFETSKFRPRAEDPHFELKKSYADAVQTLFVEFGDRLPLQFYLTLAFMCLRDDPTKNARIPDVAHLLPEGLSWQTADTMLHSFPICYRLNFHIQTVIHQHTGRVLGHSCGCDHQLCAMPGGQISLPMGDKWEILLEETESFLRHGLGQRFLIDFGMPHELGRSVKMLVADGEGDGFKIDDSGPKTLHKMVLKLSPHPAT